MNETCGYCVSLRNFLEKNTLLVNPLARNLPFFVLLLNGALLGAKASDFPSRQGPPKLTFDELLHLAVDESPPPAIAEHLQQILSQPFIDNEAALSGAKTMRPSSPGLGPVLRVAEWNIEQGLNEEQVAISLSHSDQFIDAASKVSGADLRRLKQSLAILRGADVIVLDEVDLGMKRSKYRDVARDLATALHFNYVYGVEFIELNRLYLGEKKLDPVVRKLPQDARELMGVDPSRYLGLEGAAVLSRYPINSARIIRLPQCYDWFHGEIKEISDLERAKRWSAEKIFDERVRRQVRRGGRMALIVNLAVPEAPAGQLTVVAPHLEDYCPPKCRRRQMDFLLDQVKGIENPVILAGDLNTTGHDQTPTSIRREIWKRVRSYRFWMRQVLFALIPIPFAGVIEAPINYFKNYHDPTALNLRLILPNREKPLFDDARRFRFGDGGSFDLGGQEYKTANRRGRTLSQSNERAWKGFVPTFSFQKTYFHLIGSYKIDWFLLKMSQSEKSRSTVAPFTPYYGRTLTDINTALGDRISDHVPITVDLPLTPSR